MAYYPGYVDREGRVYFRCTNCGDSRNPNHAHAFCDMKGSTWCYRCREKSSLSIEEILAIMLGETSVQEVVSGDYVAPTSRWLDANPKQRFTMLDTYFCNNAEDTDLFYMRDCGANIIGEHIRVIGQKGINKGRSGIDWPSSELKRLVSSPSKPIVCVEGPYDVISDNMVCMFGSISYSKLKHLRLHSMWLWPDPDILDNDQKRRKFVWMAKAANTNLADIRGFIVSNHDPDKATIKAHIPLYDADEWLEKGSKRWI